MASTSDGDNNVPVLHYFQGRGRAETIRLLLAAGGVEVSNIYMFDFQ